MSEVKSSGATTELQKVSEGRFLPTEVNLPSTETQRVCFDQLLLYLRVYIEIERREAVARYFVEIARLLTVL